MGIQLAQLIELLNADRFALTAATAGTYFVDNAGITADGIPVNGVVHGTVTHAGFLHAADNRFKGFQIFAGIAVKLHIADMTGVGEGVEGTLNVDLLVKGLALPSSLIFARTLIFNILIETFSLIFKPPMLIFY